MIKLTEIQREGIEAMNTFNINVEPKTVATIHGIYRNHVNGPQDFNKTFLIGDEAIYDRFNLIYTGKIVSIGAKTVTVEAYSGTINATRHRLSFSDFCSLNWNFDGEKIAVHNSAESYCI